MIPIIMQKQEVQVQKFVFELTKIALANCSIENISKKNIYTLALTIDLDNFNRACCAWSSLVKTI